MKVFLPMNIVSRSRNIRRPVVVVACLIVAATVPVVRAEEGMWTFDRAPIEAIQKQYGFSMSRPWLDHLRLASVRFNDGGSGSFVSEDGLVLTNHHVALGQLQKVSTPQRNYVVDGFYARSRQDEIKAPDLELNVLMSSENVTTAVSGAARHEPNPQAALKGRNAEIARIEKDSLAHTGLRSDVVALYGGAEYWLYRYVRYTDVRLVFAPEQQAAFFGGDPDNFTYPRYALDFALFRVYENDMPVHPTHYLKWNARGAVENELVFVSGHPGTTDRSGTVAELETLRDVDLPTGIAVITRRLAVLRTYAARGAEQARQAADMTFNLENALKAYTGELEGLREPTVMQRKMADERMLRADIGRSAEWQARYGGAWAAVERAEARRRALYKAQRFAQVRGSSLAGLGLTIVQYVSEVTKPDADRLPGFHDAQLPSLRYELLSPAPVYPDLEEALLADALEESLHQLGPSHPFNKAVLAGQTPDAAAARLIAGTRLMDVEERKRLIDGGTAAVAHSTDPLIVLGRTLDPFARELRSTMDRDVISVETAAHETIGQARFAVRGSSAYPDATFTLRLSYGVVKGYPMNGTLAPYKTTFAGLYDRSSSFDAKPPFELTRRFIAAREHVDLATPLDFVTTNDIIGGNSGSPVVNQAGELVGLIFDGNIESLVGRFVYEAAKNRAVAVHSAAIVQALRTVYDAGALADTLDPPIEPHSSSQP